MRPGFGRSGKAGFYCDLRNCCSVSCPSGCPPSFLLSVKFVTADANCTFVGQSFHSVAAPRCTRRRVLQQSHTAPFAELHQAYLWPPLTVSMPSGKKRGGVGVGGGRIALSAISMALLTNRIGVNKLELFPQRCWVLPNRRLVLSVFPAQAVTGSALGQLLHIWDVVGQRGLPWFHKPLLELSSASSMLPCCECGDVRPLMP